ncbi:MAG: hypothetical protein JSU65_06570 [Candidatus Zixiibacteriota bacterium]|nr:MAG: hypothetical protein JSU65_06570 [candidate division Zixibacteria bacterium]
MKPLFRFLLCLSATAIVTHGHGQEVIEVQRPNSSKSYLEDIAVINDLEQEDPASAVEALEALLEKNIAPHEEFGIICWRLSSLYGRLKEYDRFMNVWAKAQEKGLFFPFLSGDRSNPGFLPEIEDKEALQRLLDKNEELKQEYGTEVDAEYFVNTPEGYTTENEYPLILIIHGGAGSHVASLEYWHSSRTQSEYIVAYIQGSVVRGSYLRSFSRKTGLQIIRAAYDQIIQDYLVDTSRIIIGGPSAGGMRSLQLSLDDLIPAKGLILAFPVKPRELDAGKIMDMALRDVRVAIIGGEHDWGLKGQKEMAVLFDKLSVANRMVIFPQIGHGYPPDFSDQIDQSLDFIWKKQ